MSAAHLLAFGFVGVTLGGFAALRIAARWRSVARSEAAERGKLGADLSRAVRVMEWWRSETTKAEAERDEALALARTIDWLPPRYGDAITVADARAYMLAKGWRHEFDVRHRPEEPIVCNGYRTKTEVGAISVIFGVSVPAVEGLSDHGRAMVRVVQVCACRENRPSFDVWRDMRGFANRAAEARPQ